MRGKHGFVTIKLSLPSHIHSISVQYDEIFRCNTHNPRSEAPKVLHFFVSFSIIQKQGNNCL